MEEDLGSQFGDFRKVRLFRLEALPKLLEEVGHSLEVEEEPFLDVVVGQDLLSFPLSLRTELGVLVDLAEEKLKDVKAFVVELSVVLFFVNILVAL